MAARIWQSKARFSLAILLVMVILSSLLVGQTPLAQEPEDQSPDAVQEVGEVGVEWVASFNQCGAKDLPNCTEPECMKLYNALVGEGWTGRFHYGNNAAWETDFKRSALGGNESSYVDSVDLALFCSHGSGAHDEFWNQSLSSLYFGYPHTECHLTPGDAYRSYGNVDLEWFATFTCSVLSDGGPDPYFNRGYWAAAMDGLHLMLGMKTTMYCSSQIGQRWADYMLGHKWCFFGSCFWIRPPFTITQAWFEATDDTQPGGVCARVLAEVSDNYNDYLWGSGYVSPDPTHNGIYWYWDHCSCTPPPRQVEYPEAILELPILRVVHPDVTEHWVRENIALAFNMEETGVYSDTGHFYLMDADPALTQTLEVDIASGGYKYRVQNKLWVPPTTPPNLPDLETALVLVEDWFGDEGEELPGAWYRNGETLVMTEEMVEVETDTSGDRMLVERELQRIPVDLALSYGRVEQLPVMTSAGILLQSLSIVGPGARTKVYLGDGGEILGVQGGSRDIEQTGGFSPIVDADTAWNRFLENPAVALVSIPWAYDEVVPAAGIPPTLGYYEEPQTQGQEELVPTWVFNASFYAGGHLLAGGVLVYLPAAQQSAGHYLPPVVDIIAPSHSSDFSPGEMVTFEGHVTQYGLQPFAYEWYSSHEGFLGSGDTINAALSWAVEKGDLISHTISLQVTDANGQEGADSVMVFVRTAPYLPVILKDG